MTDNNSDVDRAIASIGGEPWAYHSFPHVAFRPPSDRQKILFTYNDLGEPEYTPEEGVPVKSPANEAIFLAPAPFDPRLEPPLSLPQPTPVRSPELRFVAPPRSPAMPAPAPLIAVTSIPVLAPVAEASADVAPPSPLVHAEAVAPDAASPAPSSAPVFERPAPYQAPPAFPLLAAALPGAAGPGYTPRYRQAAQQPAPVAVPSSVVSAVRSDVAPVLPVAPVAPVPPVVPAPSVVAVVPSPRAPVAVTGQKPAPVPLPVLADADSGMFRRI